MKVHKLYLELDGKYKESQAVIEQQKEEIHRLTFDRDRLLQQLTFNVHFNQKLHDEIVKPEKK